MYRRLISVSAVVLAMSLAGRAPAQDADVLIRNPDAAMPVIDGIIDDGWSLSTEQTISTTVAGSAPTSPTDCSGTWRALWDYDYLYGLVVVKDEALNNDSGAGSKWNDDSVEFYVDGDNSKGSTCDKNDHQYTFRWNNALVEQPSAYHNGAPSLVGIEYAIATTATGYVFEVRIPWTSIMGTGPTPGQLIGIEVFINDDDDGGDRDSQIAWYGTDGNGWQTPSMWGTGLLVAGNIAGKPNPPDGSMHPETWANLSWLPGPTAVSHDVYFGESFDEINDATRDSPAYRGNQTLTYFVVGFPGFPYPDGLVPGTTYYWRIDEINAEGTVYKGNVWRFSIPPRTAYNPSPADGAESVGPDNVTLTWTPGFGAKLHHLYLGTSLTDVETGAPGAYKGPTGVARFAAGKLESEKVYYWRVDEFDGASTYKGDIWAFTTPGAVGNPRPANRATGVQMTAKLSWTPATNATSHQVYFGVDKEAVRNATTASPEFKGNKAPGSETYDPGKLAWYSTYYWRVDAVYSTGTVKGLVWTFTTADFLLVDDFESYNDLDPPDAASNRIFDKWIDGFGTTNNGALVGNDMPPYTERTIVHGGAQAMPYSYDNNLKTSEATLTLVYPRDWTEEGVARLSLWFRGVSTNAAERMYVALNGAAVVHHDNPAVTQIGRWTEWVIDLQAFQGVNLANVNTMTIGFGTKNSPAAGGSGKLYFDDIRLYRPGTAP